MVSPGLLIIGDSQVKYGHQYTNLFEGFDVSIISQSGMKVEEIDEPKLMATQFFNDVVLHVGTNNLICGQSPEEIIVHYEAIIRKIKHGHKKIRLYMSSVLFRRSSRFKPYSRTEDRRIEEVNDKTKKLNGLLKKLATRCGTYYIENWEGFALSSPDPYGELLSRDGLHLSPRGIKCLLGNVLLFCNKTRQCFYETGQSCLETRQPYVETWQPCLETGQSCLETGQSSLETRQPCLETRQPCLETRQPCLEIRPFLETRRPCPETGQSCLETGQSCPETRQPCLETEQPCLETRQPCLETGQSCLETGQSSLETRQPCLETRKPCLETRQPCLEIRQPFLETRRPCPKTGQSCLETGQSCPETRQPCLETEQLCLETGQSCLETRQPCPETGQSCLETGKSCLETRQPCLETLQSCLETRQTVSNTSGKTAVVSTHIHPDVCKYPVVSSSEVSINSDLMFVSCLMLMYVLCYLLLSYVISKLSCVMLCLCCVVLSYVIFILSSVMLCLISSYVLSLACSLLLNHKHFQVSHNFLYKAPSYSHTKSGLNFTELPSCSCQGSRNGGFSAEESVPKKSSIYPRKCENCNKVYSSKSSFCNHKKICGKPKTNKNQNAKVCSVCNVQYNNSKSFNEHKKNCSVPSSHIACRESNCTLKFKSYFAMIDHLQTQHCQNTNQQDHVFKDMTEFLAWKQGYSKQNHISMIRVSGVKKRKLSNFYYYICAFNRQHTNRICMRKTSKNWVRGPIPNINCPARMSAKETDLGVYVKYFGAHNHDFSFSSVKYFRFDNSTQSQIRHFIEQGVPARTIQEYFQPADIDVVSPCKEHFLSLSQLNKMKYAFNMKKRLSKDDAEAVNILVHSLKAKCDNPVLIYKPQGMPTEIGDRNLDNLPHSSELFVLGIQGKKQETEMICGCTRILCIDSTHSTNQYKFYLLNLIVPDEYGVGYPVAHFITNFLDEQTLVFLFRSIQERVPDLKLNAVMTDGDEALSKAIVSVFGENIRHLLCTWHVKRNWQKNLRRKIKGNESLICEINETLLALIDEKSETNFNIMVAEFCNKYSDSARPFISYFQENYLSKKEKWAMCYRNFTHAATDTNMFAEAFHNKLKTHYLERKLNRRLDDLINILLQIHKTVHLGLMYKRLCQMPPLGFNEAIELRHMKASKISDSNVVKTGSDSVWYVRSQATESVLYKVVRKNVKCNNPELCFIKCNKYSCFGLCCHMYSCSCPDTQELCKHIHKVHSCIIRNLNPTYWEVESPLIDTSKLPLLSPSSKLPPLSPSSKLPPLSPIKENNVKLVQLICDMADKLKTFASCSERSPLLPYIYKSLKLLVEKCDGLAENQNNLTKPPCMVHDSIPPNVKITPQPRLFQTLKKKKSVKNYFKKPDGDRINEIKNALLFSRGSSFTEQIKNVHDICTPLYRIGPHSVSNLHLKSLDVNISDAEFKMLSSVDPQFCRGWLYDTIISVFLIKFSEKDPVIHIIDPAVSQLVVSKREIDEVMMVLESLNWLCYNKVIIPVNPHNNHWLLLVADIVNKQLLFYDPMCTSMKSVYNYSVDRWAQVLSSKLNMSVTDWKIRVPQHVLQKDSSSCGVFVCWYAEKVIHGERTDTTFNVNDYRKYIYEVITESVVQEKPDGRKNV